MTSLELLKEIEAWLSFNTEPTKKETAKLRKSIKEHVTEQLRIHDVVGRSEQLKAFVRWVKANDRYIVDGDFGLIDDYLKSL